ncbi:hypothetical protein HK096_006652 [Nowakowskiella sp. JEL0078]|nr:hypothetical protein HK096_006652 [Nowakowskiella sp. JEL0078]
MALLGLGVRSILWNYPRNSRFKLPTHFASSDCQLKRLYAVSKVKKPEATAPLELHLFQTNEKSKMETVPIDHSAYLPRQVFNRSTLYEGPLIRFMAQMKYFLKLYTLVPIVICTTQIFLGGPYVFGTIVITCAAWLIPVVITQYASRKVITRISLLDTSIEYLKTSRRSAIEKSNIQPEKKFIFETDLFIGGHKEYTVTAEDVSENLRPFISTTIMKLPKGKKLNVIVDTEKARANPILAELFPLEAPDLEMNDFDVNDIKKKEASK